MSNDLPETMNDVTPFMHENGKSTVRNCAEAAMEKLGADSTDWRLRDAVIWAINPWIQSEAESREDSIYKRAMESMAAQMVHPKMTALEMAKSQLGE